MNLKKLLSLALSGALALALGGCSRQPAPVVGEEYTVYTNQGYTLSVPNEYTDLLIIETPNETGPRSELFSVHEKASVEAAKKLFPGENVGGGYLFGIGLLDEVSFHNAMCADMSGAEVFAKDDKGTYYMYYHPTDVQLIREGEYTDADWEQWTTLGQWSVGARDTFIAQNEGISPYYRTNSDVDMYLCRLAYLDEEEEFTLTRPGVEGALIPSKELSLPFLRVLMNGTFMGADSSKMPDCEYISLNFPNSCTRFDFFLSDNGQANYIRQVWSDGYEALYLAAYDDGQLAGQTMLSWYIAAMQAG